MYLSPRSFINQPAQALADHGPSVATSHCTTLISSTGVQVAGSRTGTLVDSAPNARIAKPRCPWRW